MLNVNVKTLTEKEAKLIESVIGKNKMAETYDINLLLQIAGLSDRIITDPNSATGITITIPDKFINTDTSVKRVYRMVRIHDGKATVIDGTFDAKTKQFTFATDGYNNPSNDIAKDKRYFITYCMASAFRCRSLRMHGSNGSKKRKLNKKYRMI